MAWIESKTPGFAGAALGMVVGVVLLGYGVWSFFEPVPPPMPQSFSLVLLGFTKWLVCFYTMRKVRIAWSFALSMAGTGAVVFLFGAPKVRTAFDTSLAVGVMPAVVMLAITVLLAMSAEEFDRETR